MRIISFAKTTPALLAGRKTVTRREWKDSYAESFHEGELLQAWDRLPRTGKGKRIGTIRLTCAPYKERSDLITRKEFEAEGLEYLSMGENGIIDWPLELYRDWKWNPRDLWVVRFELEPRHDA